MDKPSFKDLYSAACDQPTPRQAFLAKCAEITGAAENTVVQWAHGIQRPNISALKLLCTHFDCEADTLFPKPIITNESN